MNAFKIKALEAQVSDLKKAASSCNKLAKDPAKCKMTIDKKIAKLNDKIKKLKSK